MTLRIGDKGTGVLQLQRALIYLKYTPGSADGDFGPKVEAAVEKFQRDHDLYADGIVGHITIAHINNLIPPNFWISELVVTFIKPPPVPGAPEPTLMSWVSCPAEVAPGRAGYTSTVLRSDTAVAYDALHEKVLDMGGRVTSAGGKRALASSAGPNRSRTSMHYVGRAFDRAVPTGMVDPATDQYIIVRVGETRKWTVWCCSDIGLSDLQAKCKELGIEGGLMTLEGTYVSKKKVLTKTVTRVCFNFTDLAAKFGFESISARPAFFNEGDVSASEWWHLTWTAGLVVGRSTFGDELLKVYSLEDAKKFIYWNEAKDAIYGVSWF